MCMLTILYTLKHAVNETAVCETCVRFQVAAAPSTNTLKSYGEDLTRVNMTLQTDM